MTYSSEASAVIDFIGGWGSQIVATSVHAGHGLRAEIAEQMVLDEDVRLREEGPPTDVIAAAVESRVLTSRSRFEVDLNRPREEAVCREPDDCWGLDVWAEGTLSEQLTAGSLAAYDEFYARLAERLDEVAARGPFVLLDVHSYNQRREGSDARPSRRSTTRGSTSAVDAQRRVRRLSAYEQDAGHPVQHVCGWAGREGQGHRRHARDVPRRARHRGQQADGGQRLHPRRLGQRAELVRGQLRPAIIGELERKINIRQHYPEIDNTSRATS